MRLLKNNPWFDGKWYLVTYVDVAKSRAHPLVHYLRFGASENRDPSPDFDGHRYLQRYPEVSATGMSPLEYHVRVGEAGGLIVERPAAPRVPAPGEAIVWRRVIRRALTTAADSVMRKKRAIVVDWSLPTPDRDSGSLSSLNYILALSRLGYTVTFVPKDLVRHEKYAKQLETHGVVVWTRPRLGSVDDALREGRTFDLALLIRPESYQTVAPALRERSPLTPVVYVPTDLHHVRMEAQARLLEQPDLAAAAEHMRQIELENVRDADLTLLISNTELALLRECEPGAWVELVPMARAAPPGPAASVDRDDIVFVGGFRHAPNVDAVNWFLDEVWPIVESRLPRARFVVYGSDLPEGLADRASERVVMRGYVDEVGEAFAQARLTVVPLRFGAGIKGKVVSAMHAGVPIVATSVGIDGMGLDGEVLVADDPASFAAAVIEVYENTELATRQAAAALATAGERFSADALTSALSALLPRLR